MTSVHPELTATPLAPYFKNIKEILGFVATPSVGVNMEELTVSDRVRLATQQIVGEYVADVAAAEIVEPQIKTSTFTVRKAWVPFFSRWRPARAYDYTTVDPWAKANPGIVRAVRKLTSKSMAVARAVDDVQESTGGKRDPSLAYNFAGSVNGKRPTIITQEICRSDPEGLGDWVLGLPNAQRLHVVAHPDDDTYLYDPTQPNNIRISKTTKLLAALVIGAENAWEVRGREQGQSHVFSEMHLEKLRGPMRILSMGSGTGGPAIDNALRLLAQYPNLSAIVYGADHDVAALEVAKFQANAKREQLGDPSRLQFVPIQTEGLFDKETLQALIRQVQPHFLESDGLTEYLARAKPKDKGEAEQRTLMARRGWMSAEEFHNAVYEAMPKGSVWKTGNMQPNREEDFVIKVLGWGFIIRRTLDEYRDLIRASGIPRKAVVEYRPSRKNRARIYNMLAITKL